MRISILPCLTCMLYFHVLDYFKILVCTALFQLTCMHACIFLPGVYVCVSVKSSRLVTYICTLLLSAVFRVQFSAPSCRTYFLWQKRKCLYTQFYIQSDPPAQLWRSSSALQALWCSVPVWHSHWRLCDKWQLYLCVLHESIKHWPFKNAPQIFEAVSY